MKERYLKVVKPQLMSRGLILPQKLKHSSTRFIHNRSLAITGKTPKYMSVADIMSHEKRMEEQEWNHFLTYMMKARIYVVEDWDSTLCQIETLFYDHGIIEPDDGSETEMFKGDFDAAFDEEMQEANLGFLIFRGRDIHHCQVNFSVPCTSSVMAEAYAAAALLMKASELGIKKLVLWTDNMEVRGVINGDHNIKVEDVNRGIFMSLRKLRKNFEKVITLWKARELNQMADDLVKLDKATLLHPTFPLQALERWRPHLEGQPIFRFTQISEIKSMIYKFGQGQPYEGSTSKVVMLEVGEVCKFDCMLGLLDGFDPDDMYVQVHEFDTRPEDLKLKFMEFFSKARADAVDGISFFHRDCNSARKDNRRAILVVFDSNPWERTFYTNRLTVVLVAPEEANFRGRHNLRRLSALDYALFCSEKE